MGGVTTHLLGQVCDLGTVRHSQVQDVPILSFGLVDTSGRAIKVLVFGEHAESVEVQAGLSRKVWDKELFWTCCKLSSHECSRNRSAGTRSAQKISLRELVKDYR